VQAQEELIAELEKRNSELERFTYTVSHDLKSPLVTVRGFLGYLKKDVVKGDINRLHENIRYIEDATDKMEALLQDLLQLSRIGRLVNPPQEIPFNALVNEAVLLLSGQLRDNEIALVIMPDMPLVWGDQVRLVEVLQNLIDNAIKFSQTQLQPKVEVGVATINNETAFYVKDNGIGIAAPYHEQVFGLFNRLDPSIEGTGIGLALVKRIIEVHNGRIWIESNGPKTGTTVFFTLPASDPSLTNAPI